MKLSAEIDEDNSRLGMYRSLFYNFMSIFELKKKKQHYYRFEILLFAEGFTPASYQVHLKWSCGPARWRAASPLFWRGSAQYFLKENYGRHFLF